MCTCTLYNTCVHVHVYNTCVHVHVYNTCVHVHYIIHVYMYMHLKLYNTCVHQYMYTCRVFFIAVTIIHVCTCTLYMYNMYNICVHVQCVGFSFVSLLSLFLIRFKLIDS